MEHFGHILNREICEPLHSQLATVLRKELQGMPPGSRFYGDKELCGKYAVSLPVARSAMTALVREGRVCRIRSQGTFVAKRKPAGQRRRQRRIGVVAPLGAFPHTAAIQAIQQAMVPSNSDLILVKHPSPPINTPELILEVVQAQLTKLDGLVWVSAFMENLPRSLPALGEIADRLVFINLRLPDHDLSCVCADYEGAAFALTEHLIKKGFKKIGYIGGPAGRLAADLRLAGFEKAMLSHGMQIDPQYMRAHAESMGSETGKTEILKMLSAGRPPEAIVAATDQLARGVITGLGESGLHVPENVALTGFDDDIAMAAPPYLTTARLPFYELGEKAIQLLLHQLAGTLAPGAAYQVECPLFVRESSGAGASAPPESGSKALLTEDKKPKQ